MVDIQWLIGGEAGYGIMTTGTLMAKVFTRLGYSVFDYVEYPSLIRGGHNAYYVRGSDAPIYSQKRPVDILVPLNRETIDRHKRELSENAVILYDPSLVKIADGEFVKQHALSVPFVDLTHKVGANRLMINTLSVGASLALFYDNYEILGDILRQLFERKGEEVVAENINTAKAGFDYVREHYADKFGVSAKKKQQDSLLIGGAEAVGLGAIRAGVKFAAIYPMTPINTVMTTLTDNALKYGIVIKEPEDEIGGINMAIGASFAGARSIVATSGGGFSLMVEALGLASQTETPLVIIEGMRPGPATGMPTWTDQGDLRFVLHAAQGDFPRIVLAPGNVLEAFVYTMQAFNLADKYQMPVIVLVDKYLIEGRMTARIDELKMQSAKFKIERGKIVTDEDLASQTDYKRYLLTDDGISPRSIPGQKGGIGLSGSDEHDERGLYNEESEVRIAMMDKRFRKIQDIDLGVNPFDLHGSSSAPLTLVGFGSTQLPVLEAMQWLKRDGIDVNYLSLNVMAPFPSELVAPMLRDAEKTLVVELNKTGQLEGLLREHTGLSMDYNFRKYDGRPFYPEEIVEKVKTVLSIKK